MEIKIMAEVDKNCTGRLQHYVIGHKNSPMSGGIYLERGKEPPSKITIFFRREKKKND